MPGSNEQPGHASFTTVKYVDENLYRLVELFYGLAIANGLAIAIPSLVRSFSLSSLGYVVAGLLIGITDWLGFHLLFAPLKYRGLARLLLDMLFPVLVFFFFAVSAEPLLEIAGFLLYFTLGLIYAGILRHEGYGTSLPVWVGQTLWLCLVIAFFALIAVSFCSQLRALPPLLIILSALLLSASLLDGIRHELLRPRT